MKAHTKVEVEHISFLTLTLEGGEYSVHTLATLHVGKDLMVPTE